jgi:hypothetical protein
MPWSRFSACRTFGSAANRHPPLRRGPDQCGRPLTKLAAVLASLFTAMPVLACDLALVAPATSTLKKPVRAAVSVADDILNVQFSVATPTLNARKSLGPKQHPYMFDVVELFVTFSNTGFPYYEFEVSPYNQVFQVRILSRTEPFQEGVDLGLMSVATILPTGWSAQLKVPLKQIGWDGDTKKIRGNLYSILGVSPKRSFWSSFLPKAPKANFHQPRFFQALLQCE